MAVRRWPIAKEVNLISASKVLRTNQTKNSGKKKKRDEGISKASPCEKAPAESDRREEQQQLSSLLSSPLFVLGNRLPPSSLHALRLSQSAQIPDVDLDSVDPFWR